MKRFKAIILLFVFSCTLLGFNLEGHYCDGELTDISFMGESGCKEHCKTKKEAPKKKKKKCCHKKSNEQAEAKTDANADCVSEKEGGCCKTETLSDLSELEYSVQLTYVQPQVLINILLDYKLFDEEELEVIQEWQAYKEPVPDEDRQVLHQSFLI